jgi:hypothetical protein
MLADSQTRPEGPLYSVFIRNDEGKRKLWKNTPEREKAELEVKALKVHGFDAVIVEVQS